jgi:hypothetical protein
MSNYLSPSRRRPGNTQIMGTIPSKEKWLASTALRGKIRSGALNKVDDAISNYWKQGGDASPNKKANVTAIRVALQGWKRHHGENWKASERNKPPGQAISALDEAVKDTTHLNAKDKEAIAFIIENREKRIRQIFGQANINLRLFNAMTQVKQAAGDLKTSAEQLYKAQNGDIANHGAAAGNSVKRGAVAGSNAHSAAGKLLKPAHQVNQAAGDTAATFRAASEAALSSQLSEIKRALSELFGEPIKDIKSFLANLLAESGLSGAMAAVQHIADMLPILSLISGGAKALAAAGAAVYAAYKQYKFSTHGFAIEGGAPSAAFQAVQTLLARNTANATAKAAIEGAGFAANTALHAAKGVGAVFAPAVKAATATANAIRMITMFAVQVRETLIIRRLLKDPKNMDLGIFAKAPLLGAYMLVGSDTSDLVAMLYESFGADGWKAEIESLIKKHIHPVLDQCASLIQSSPFIITNIPLHRAANRSTLSALAHAVA